ncbi:MAG: excalibur calcium-binding domain-containing protein [Thiotrichaceae bacterium]
MKIIALSFLGFIAVLISILVLFSLSLPTRPKYPVTPEIPSTTLSSQPAVNNHVSPSESPASGSEKLARILVSSIETTPPAAPPAVVEPPHAQPVPISPPKPVTAPAAATSNYRCAGKTHCSHMSSCEEATFYLRNCPGVKIDGDGNGIPCEKQWCRR